MDTPAGRQPKTVSDKAIRDMTGTEFFELQKKNNPVFRKFTKLFDTILSFSPYRPEMRITNNAADAAREIYDKGYSFDTDEENADFARAVLAKYPERDPLSFVGNVNRFAGGTPTLTMKHLRELSEWDINVPKRGLFVKKRSDSKDFNEVSMSHYGMYEIAYKHLLNSPRDNPEPESLYIATTLHPLLRTLLDNEDKIPSTVGEVMDFIHENPERLRSYYKIEFWQDKGWGRRSNGYNFENTYGNPEWVSNAYRSIVYGQEGGYANEPTAKSREEATKWMAWLHHAQNQGEILEEHRGGGKNGYAVRSHDWADVPFHLARDMSFTDFERYYKAGINDVTFIQKAHAAGIDADLAASMRQNGQFEV